MPPAVNARLLTVQTRAGGTDDFNPSTDDPTVVWEGAVDAWYEERRQRAMTAEGSSVTVWRSLICDPIPADIAAGMQVVFERGGAHVEGIVQAVETSDHPLVPEYLQTTRLTLELG